MDRAISASEANQRFSELLRAVAAGDSFTVTSRGRPVARIAPYKNTDRREAVKRLLDHVGTMPVRSAAPWTREDLYD
jgi:prevent-host-death family protein